MLALQIQQMTLGGIFPLPQGLTLGLFMVLSFAYLLGTGFNILVRMGYAVRSQVNTHTTRLDFLRDNWDNITVRVCVYGYLAFYAWALHPEFLKVAASAFGAPDWLSNWAIFPVNVATSLGFGFFIDVLIDFAQSYVASKPSLAWLNTVLRGRIPSYDANVVDVAALKAKENPSPVPKE